jgi:hypothetical protein
MPETKIQRRVARAAVIDQWSPGIQPRWSVSQVRSALDLHMAGDFSQSARMVDAMMLDDEIPTSLDMLVEHIVGSEFSLQPETDEDGEAVAASERMRDALGPLWHTAFPEHQIAQLLRWFVMLGVAVAVVDWDTSASPWRPSLRVLHPEQLRWDAEELDKQSGTFGVFKFQARDGEHVVTPGDGRWVLLSDGPGSWIRSSVCAIAHTWIGKHYAFRDWNRWSERHGLPILKAFVPVVADEEDESAFARSLRSIGTETSITLPTGLDENGLQYDIDLLEAKDRSWDGFESLIRHCDRKFQVHFLGTNTNELIGAAGSRATSETGRDITSSRAASLERRITTDLRDQLVKPFCALNVPGAALALAPWPHWQVEPESDAAQQAAGAMAMFGAVSAAKAAGLEVKNVVELAEKYGFVVEEREVEEPKEEPAEKAVDSEPMEEREEQGEELAQLSEGETKAPTVDQVGKRDGAVQGQKFLDDLVDELTEEGDEREELDAKRMAAIVAQAESPEDLFRLLDEHLEDSAPMELAGIYEKALILSELMGRFAVLEDL